MCHEVIHRIGHPVFYLPDGVETAGHLCLKSWRICIGLVLMIAVAVGQAAEPVVGPLHESGFDGYIQQQQLAYQSFDRWPGVRVKRLGGDAETGRLALYAEFPAGFHLPGGLESDKSIELLMLDGSLRLGDQWLTVFDFAFIPPGLELPQLESDQISHALVFFDPASADPVALQNQQSRGHYVRKYSEDDWEPAALAKSAGAQIDLKIFHLKKDPDTSARSWLVKLDGDMKVPWEVHSMAEEGYLLEGGYVLAECLPGRTVIGEYRQGGYFWRPGGIPHSGPESGPVGRVIWLQRSPVALDVVFYRGCENGQARDPVKAAG